MENAAKEQALRHAASKGRKNPGGRTYRNMAEIARVFSSQRILKLTASCGNCNAMDGY